MKFGMIAIKVLLFVLSSLGTCFVLWVSVVFSGSYKGVVIVCCLGLSSSSILVVVDAGDSSQNVFLGIGG